MSSTHDLDSLIKALEAEYDLDVGFVGQLRQGVFDPTGLNRLVTLLESIQLGDENMISRRLVALLWMIPTIMNWQIPRVAEHGGDIARLQRGIDRVEAALEVLLGIP